MDHPFDKECDFSGLECPIPLLRTKKFLSECKPGEILKIIATDPGTVADMNTLVSITHHELLHHEKKGGNYYFWIKREE